LKEAIAILQRRWQRREAIAEIGSPASLSTLPTAGDPSNWTDSESTMRYFNYEKPAAPVINYRGAKEVPRRSPKPA